MGKRKGPTPLFPVKSAHPILKIACAYHRAINYLGPFQVELHDFAVAWPSATLQTFVVELLFKAIIAIETGGVPKTHRYLDLMAALTPQSQARLTVAFTRRFAESGRVAAMREARRAAPDWPDKQPFPENLQDVLGAMNNSFEQVRYVFEGSVPSLFAGELVPSLFEVVGDLDPGMLRACLNDRTIDLKIGSPVTRSGERSP